MISPFQSPDRKYPIKSAEVISDIDANTRRVYVFDHFGDWEYLEDFVYSGRERTQLTVHSMTITDIGLTIIVDLLLGTGVRIRTGAGESVGGGGVDMSRQTLFYAFDQNEVTQRGVEEVAGKLCDVYSVKGWGYQGTFWLWNGIPLQARVNGISMTATSFRENPNLSKTSYIIPEYIKITDEP